MGAETCSHAIAKMEYPLTQNVLEHVYSADVRARFEELVKLFQQAATERGTLNAQQADLELVNRIHRSFERRELTRSIRAENEARLPLFAQVVAILLEHAAANNGYRLAQTVREDFSEVLFTCDREGHTYRRRALVPERVANPSSRTFSAVPQTGSLSPTRMTLRREHILYSHGDETLDDRGKLHCGNCGEKTTGIPLSRVHILRERHFESHVENCLRSVFLETGEATKKKSSETRGTLDARIIDAVREHYPEVYNGMINWRRLYSIFENIARRNIDPEIVFAKLPAQVISALRASIGHNVPTPLCAMRSRQKYDLRRAYKTLVYVSRAEVYEILHRDGRTNPITKPFDDWGVRCVFGSVPECYHLKDTLDRDPRFKSIPHTVKDRIRTPSETGYQSLHAGYVFHATQGALPFELQIRTHTMDARAEYDDDKQDHDSRERGFIAAMRRVCAPWREPLFIALLAPDEHTRRMRTLRDYIGPPISQVL